VGEESHVPLDAIYALTSFSKIHLRGCHHSQKLTAFGLAEFQSRFDGRDFELAPVVHTQMTDELPSHQPTHEEPFHLGFSGPLELRLRTRQGVFTRWPECSSSHKMPKSF
jgi:hypothetical protein